jgi:hypothetical protein
MPSVSPSGEQLKQLETILGGRRTVPMIDDDDDTIEEVEMSECNSLNNYFLCATFLLTKPNVQTMPNDKSVDKRRARTVKRRTMTVVTSVVAILAAVAFNAPTSRFINKYHCPLKNNIYVLFYLRSDSALALRAALAADRAFFEASAYDV